MLAGEEVAMNRALLREIGIPAFLSTSLLGFSLLLVVTALLPALELQDSLRSESDQLTQRIERHIVLASKGENGAAELLPSKVDMANVPEGVRALAEKYGLPLDQGTYRVSEVENIWRYEVQLPLKASYPQLRKFLREAMVFQPVVSLDEISLHRGKAVDPTLEATVRLTYYFVGQ